MLGIFKEKREIDDLISSGEFAKLVGTNKSTLRYYESIGLLEPYISDNNYRYYSPFQIAEYYRILSMQRIGYSLFDIRPPEQVGLSYVDWIKKSNAEHYETLKAQVFNLEKTMRDTHYAQSFWNEASYMQPGVPMLVRYENEMHWYACCAQHPEKGGVAQSLSEHIRVCQNNSRVHTFPYGLRLGAGDESLDFLSHFSFSDECPQEEGYASLPAGTYLKFLALGSSVASIASYYPAVVNFLHEHNLRQTTDLFAVLLFSSVHFSGTERGIAICMMGVSPGADTP